MSLFTFTLTINLFTGSNYFGVLSLLVGLWSIEQVFKLNKKNGRNVTSWHRFFHLIKSVLCADDEQGKVLFEGYIKDANDIALERRAAFKIVK